MSQNVIIHVPTLDCPDELALIERGLRGVEGVFRLSPDYLARNLHVEFDPSQMSPPQILKAIEDNGFPAHVALPVAGGPSAVTLMRPPRNVIIGGILLAAAAGVALFVGSTVWPAAVLAIASTVVSGRRVAAAAWRAVRLRALDMNVLMSVAAAGAIAIGDYFEAGTAMFLFAVSLWLEQLSLVRAERAVRSLVELAPNVAHRLLDRGTAQESAVDVNSSDLQVGDHILIRPGERIPTDSEVLTGRSAVNQGPITGESRLIEKQPGDRLFAGTINGDESLVATVTHPAEESTLAHIARLVDQARTRRSRTERFIDAFARRYTPCVITLALAIMIVPPILAQFNFAWATAVETQDWIYRGLVLLVIACPCALVISTPVTEVSGLYRAARSGILVKGAEVLEKAAALRTLAVDKTGTVTTGVMEVSGIEPFDGRSTDEVLALAAALERHSEHPLGAAITAAAEKRGIAISGMATVTTFRGCGVRGELNGNTYFLGNARLFDESDFQLSITDAQRLRSAARDGASVNSSRAWLGTKNRLLGVFHLADRPRPGTAEAIVELRRLGVDRVLMLTGDNAAAAAAIAQEIGIPEVYADLLPQDKIDRVRALAGRGHLAMVGDGVNDAPALAAADVGIALGGQSSDTALETADVVIMTPDLAKVAELIRLSRRCRRLLKQNIAFSLLTKCSVMVLATAGMATMFMAVAADVGASLIVIANGLRMIRLDRHA